MSVQRLSIFLMTFWARKKRIETGGTIALRNWSVMQKGAEEKPELMN